MRYFFHIGYKGSSYRGWQKQVNAKSVQESIEDVLSKFLKQKIHCIGCGRTDAGVHSSQYYFHIDIEEKIEDHLFFPLNRMLPPDIAIYHITKVDHKNHAQHSATERTYNYFIHTHKNPFLSKISALYNVTDLDVIKMQEAANYLLGKKDFRALCKTPDRHNHTECDIRKAQFYTNESGKFIRFEIRGNRFLKGMIRILMHELIEVGKNKISPQQFQNCLLSKTPPNPLNMAYPQGLYLSEISYPFLKQQVSEEFCPMLKMHQWRAIKIN
nr:tRNA pseudouridine(38-40) synthase TruA [uncultured Marinifilum sp.]